MKNSPKTKLHRHIWTKLSKLVFFIYFGIKISKLKDDVYQHDILAVKLSRPLLHISLRRHLEVA